MLFLTVIVQVSDGQSRLGELLRGNWIDKRYSDKLILTRSPYKATHGWGLAPPPVLQIISNSDSTGFYAEESNRYDPPKLLFDVIPEDSAFTLTPRPTSDKDPSRHYVYSFKDPPSVRRYLDFKFQDPLIKISMSRDNPVGQFINEKFFAGKYYYSKNDDDSLRTPIEFTSTGNILGLKGYQRYFIVNDFTFFWPVYDSVLNDIGYDAIILVDTVSNNYHWYTWRFRKDVIQFFNPFVDATIKDPIMHFRSIAELRHFLWELPFKRVLQHRAYETLGDSLFLYGIQAKSCCSISLDTTNVIFSLKSIVDSK
jgi:hypothetical protein